MPQKKAAFKALRQDVKRNERNKVARKVIKDLKKQAEKLIAANKKDEAKVVFVKFQKAVDKAAKAGGFLQANTASRYKARLGAKITALSKK